MKHNVILEEIFKVLKSKSLYKKALKCADKRPKELSNDFSRWFVWADIEDEGLFWSNINAFVENHLYRKCQDPIFRLKIYEYLLSIFENKDDRYPEGFCRALGSVKIRRLGELYRQNPMLRGMFWFIIVENGKDELRCNALLEAIRLVKLEINDSQTLSTSE